MIENDICLLVGNIDEYGNPWVEFEINELDIGVVYYSMGVGQYAMAVNAVNDDSWEYAQE
ncbi:hypothetical protein [Armatimonas sp.]|uniref:hypothetical protein n=1 Tax=Armatimonas sp. TaxID=1872638 RepID=UPI0037525E82